MSHLIEGAVNGDKHQLRILLERFEKHILALQQSTGTIASNTDAASPVNPAPAAAQLSVSASGSGFIAAAVTNPQFLRSTVPAQKRGNLARSPMIHAVRYSTDPNFKSNVVSLPPSVQTHYQLPTGGKPMYLRIKSSVDGVNFNQEQQSGPHTA